MDNTLTGIRHRNTIAGSGFIIDNFFCILNFVHSHKVLQIINDIKLNKKEHK